MRGELKYWVGVAGFNGLGPKRFKLLREYFGSVKAIWQASVGELAKTGIKREMVEKWDQWRQTKNLDKEMEELGKREIKVITCDDKRYPKLLKEVDIAPFVIFVKGDEKILSSNCLAVIGTRRMSTYGQQATQRLVKQLVAKGLIIVSGLARGVDSLAHRVCLGSKGKTVAVLGHGLDRVYPIENTRLAEEIVVKGGVLVSEYALGYPIAKGNFPARNRIIAGLSLGVLVIEGAQRSGTKITANWAADFGREVLAVPGPITSGQSEATADLIKQGAKLVTRVEDVLEEINLSGA